MDGHRKSGGINMEVYGRLWKIMESHGRSSCGHPGFILEASRRISKVMGFSLGHISAI